MRTCVVALAVLLAACVGSKEADVPPDERFGHRFEEEGPEGRRTLDVTSPAQTAQYFYYPAVIDTIHVRPAAFASELAQSGEVPVEILVKGSIPDACTELHDLTQERAGHLITMRLEMRKEQGAICATVIRPFRFYVRLDGLYPAGSYTLKLNRKVFPFAIRADES